MVCAPSPRVFSTMLDPVSTNATLRGCRFSSPLANKPLRLRRQCQGAETRCWWEPGVAELVLEQTTSCVALSFVAVVVHRGLIREEAQSMRGKHADVIT